MKAHYLLLVTFLLSSCSMFEGRSLFGGDGDKQEKGEKSKTVSRAEYEALQKKYDELNKRYQMMAAADAIKADDEVIDESMDLKAKLKMASEGETAAKQMNTVDTFKAASAQRTDHIVIRSEVPLNESEVEKEIDTLRRANLLISKNRFNEALVKLRSIEKSKSKQIQIRAKFGMGEILFRQKEYDLAMQIFEEIIKKDSFSGVVLKTLGRLIACSNKLKLKQKEDQYSSMLYDFFES